MNGKMAAAPGALASLRMQLMTQVGLPDLILMEHPFISLA